MCGIRTSIGDRDWNDDFCDLPIHTNISYLMLMYNVACCLGFEM